MTVQEEFSRVYQVRKIPAEGLAIALEATPEECAALAVRMGILSCESLAAELMLTVSDGGRRVAGVGSLRAQVTQACIVSLEPVPETVDEPLELLFLDESLIDAEDEYVMSEEDLYSDEPVPDPIVRGSFDVGAAISECLALALDPYPRRADAVFEAPDDPEPDEPKRNPFAALKALQGGEGSDTDGNET